MGLAEEVEEARQAGDWTRALALMERLAAEAPSQVAKAELEYRMALLALRDLGDPARAATLYADCLATDPAHGKAFETLALLLTDAGDWKQLERAYRRRLRATMDSDDTAQTFELWRELGRIYEQNLFTPSSAIEAYRMALRLKPDAELAQRLQELEAAG